MKKLLTILCLVLLTSCGPSQEERQQAELEQQRLEKEASEKLAQETSRRIAAVTCAVMQETRNMDAAVRVEKINEGREKIGGEPFLSGDDAIKEALEFGLCQALVLDENYNESLQPLKDAIRERERIAAEKRAEEERIAIDHLNKKRAEEARIAAEEARITAEKRAEEIRKRIANPWVQEYFYSNGQLKAKINYQSKNDGGKQHGLSRKWYANGQLKGETTFKNGKLDGDFTCYTENGQAMSRGTFKEGKAGRNEGLVENKWRRGSRIIMNAVIEAGWFSDACLDERNGNSCC